MDKKVVVGIDASPTHVGLAKFKGKNLVDLWYKKVPNMDYMYQLALDVVDVLKGWGQIDCIVLEHYKYNMSAVQYAYNIGEFIGILKFKIVTDLGIPILLVHPSRLNKIVHVNKRDKKARVKFVEDNIIKGKIECSNQVECGDKADAILLAWIMVMYYNDNIRIDLAKWYSKKDLFKYWVDLKLGLGGNDG